MADVTAITAEALIGLLEGGGSTTAPISKQDFAFFLEDYVVEGGQLSFATINNRQIALTGMIVSFQRGLYVVTAKSLSVPDNAAKIYVDFTVSKGFVAAAAHPAQGTYLPLFEIDYQGSTATVTDLSTKRDTFSVRFPNNFIIPDGTITTQMLADDLVTSDKIKDLSIQQSHIIDQQINSRVIADSAVTTIKIANLAVTTGKINDQAVTDSKLATDSVSARAIATSAVGTPEIADAAVTTAKLASGSVTLDKLAPGVVIGDGGGGGGGGGGPALNVKTYGALGDGVADDTAAIQSAFAALGGSGGSIIFPEGVYKITRLDVIISNAIITAEKGATLHGSHLKATDQRYLINTSYSAGDVVISSRSGLGVNSYGVSAGDAFYKALTSGLSGTTRPTHASGTAVHGAVTWEFVSDIGKIFRIQGDNNVIENMLIQYSGDTRNTTGFFVNGLHVVGSDNVISNVAAKYCNGLGIAAGSSGSRNNDLQNCRSQYNGYAGFGTVDPTCENVKVIGGDYSFNGWDGVSNPPNNTYSDAYGIYFRGKSGKIDGTNVRYNYRNGIGTQYVEDSIEIINNRVFNTGGDTINWSSGISIGNNARNVLIEGNVISNMTTTSLDSGIQFWGTSGPTIGFVNAIISKNRFTNLSRSIRFNTFKTERLLIEGNQFKQAGNISIVQGTGDNYPSGDEGSEFVITGNQNGDDGIMFSQVNGEKIIVTNNDFKSFYLSPLTQRKVSLTLDNNRFTRPISLNIQQFAEIHGTINSNFIDLITYAPLVWATNTAYTVGIQVTANGRLYTCSVAGTSGSTAPSHSSGNATDNTVTWQYNQVLMSPIDVFVSSGGVFEGSISFNTIKDAPTYGLLANQNASYIGNHIINPSRSTTGTTSFNGIQITGGTPKIINNVVKSKNGKMDVGIRIVSWRRGLIVSGNTLEHSTAGKPLYHETVNGRLLDYECNPSTKNFLMGYTDVPADYGRDWKIGDRVYHAAPVPGEVFGYLCTSAGEVAAADWAANTAYLLNAVIVANSKIYQCLSAGTSGTVAPSHVTEAEDGTVTWAYRAPLANFSAMLLGM